MTPIKDLKLQGDMDFNGVRPTGSPYATLGVFLNIKDPPYNATGDGVADDSDAINSAMADAVANGGGTVFFPKGVYLCDIAPTPGTYNSILNIPWTGNDNPFASPPSASLLLLGEVQPSHSVVMAAADANMATIKTTRTTDTLPAALMAGNSYRGEALVGGSDYSDRNGTYLTIKNLSFILPSDPKLHGLRLEGMGNVRLESVNVIAGGGEPSVNSIGIWTPNSANWGENLVDYCLASGFQTGVRSGEHLFARQILVVGCKVGVDFAGSIYASYGNLQIINCADGVKFTGYHPVDLLVVNEHSPSADWTASLHDIKDPSNYGVGVIRHMVGNGGAGTFIPASLDGGAGLMIHELFAGQIRLPTGSGAGGSALSKITGRGTVPPGGTTGQSLKKLSNADYDVGWA